ncbi:hypothetical protein Pnap_4968 (plasmid) [Polaromonas naphthalenivorans CJ2]|uniref:Uncharacterized protein n=1 Tax=Polaromonas naphthalenivorans (strain CJ2) TaxID=365044 RepID=A1VWK1_POLNA|nr:hypothetical protein Pnap_4968 [Polaromonas naphthalenivorans CJ2]
MLKTWVKLTFRFFYRTTSYEVVLPHQEFLWQWKFLPLIDFTEPTLRGFFSWNQGYRSTNADIFFGYLFTISGRGLRIPIWQGT